MDDIKLNRKEKGSNCNILGWRHVQYILMFLATVVSMSMRTGFPLAVIAMMDPSPPNSTIPTYPEWTEKSAILSSFFWGYVIPQIPAGELTKHISPKRLMGITMFINSLLTLLTPVLASNVGQYGVISARAIQGFSQGFLFPSFHSLIGKWAPLSERSKAVSFIYTGGTMGTIISMVTTGVIADSSVGWPAVFYLYGAIGIAWVVLWMCMSADSPSLHNKISQAEKEFIQGGIIDQDKKEVATPWKSILTSVPMLALILVTFGQEWGFWTLAIEIPSYMAGIMKFDLSENGFLSALPYLVFWLTSFIYSPLADFFVVRQYFSVINVRRLFTTIALLLPAICLTWLAFVDVTRKELAIALLVISLGFNSAIFPGFLVNHIDLAPNHAGVLMGITNGISMVASIIAPFVVDIVGKKEDDPLLWRYVFCISAGFFLVSNLIMVIFGSGETQPWNEPEDTKSESKSEYEIQTSF